MKLWSRLRLPVNTFSIRHELIRRNLPLGPGDAVLDVGVGTGYSAFLFAEMVGAVVGLDVAAPVTAFLNGLPHPPNLRFVTADIQEPAAVAAATGGGRFTKVYAGDVLEHVADPAAFFVSLATALAPGGLALVTFPNVAGHGVTHFAQRSELERIVAEAKLRTLRLEVVRRTWWLASVQTVLARWPLAVHRAFRKRGRPAPQTYDETFSFAFNRRRPWYGVLVNAYFEGALAAARFGRLFRYAAAPEDIRGERLLMVVERAP